MNNLEENTKQAWQTPEIIDLNTKSTEYYAGAYTDGSFTTHVS